MKPNYGVLLPILFQVSFNFVSTSVLAQLPVPGSISGTCQQGIEYRIRSVDDLRQSEAELQCIFTSALTPSKVPLGPHQAGVLVVLNAPHFLVNPVADLLWRGSFAFKVECHNGDPTPSYIGFHDIAGITSLPFSLHIQTLAANLAPGEYEDNRESLFMDFKDDFPKTCPNYGNYVDNNQDTVPTRVRPMPNVYPVRAVLDLLRFVGRQDDGGAIYLGKTYLQDYLRTDKRAATIAFWQMVCYDEEVNPEFEAGQALPPQAVGYNYTFPGFASALLPIPLTGR